MTRSAMGLMGWVTWTAATVWLAGCFSAERHEATAQECDPARGNLDEDGDGLFNCADPDCATFDFCTGSITVVEAGVTDDGPDGSSAGTDGGSVTSDGAIATSDGSTVDPDADAGKPMCKVDAECPKWSACVDEVCEREPLSLQLTIVRATAPLAKADDGTPKSDCLDPTKAYCIWVPPVDGIPCTCPPDPYVVVKLNGNEVVGETTPVKTTLDAKWASGAPFLLTLAPDDVLTFHARDDDAEIEAGQSEAMFECEVKTSGLWADPQTQVLSCTAPTPNPLDTSNLLIEATVSSGIN